MFSWNRNRTLSSSDDSPTPTTWRL